MPVVIPEVKQNLQCKHQSESQGFKYNFSAPKEFLCFWSVCSGLCCSLCLCNGRSGDRPGGLPLAEWGQQKQRKSISSQTDEKSHFPPHPKPALPKNNCHHNSQTPVPLSSYMARSPFLGLFVHVTWVACLELEWFYHCSANGWEGIMENNASECCLRNTHAYCRVLLLHIC